MADANFIPSGLGWHRDLPDPRDYSPGDVSVARLLEGLKNRQSGRAARPARIDWREFCPPVCDQQQLNSSTAHACVAMIQSAERRASGRLIEPSPLFVYKMARSELKWSGDSGAKLRTSLQALKRFGLPPEPQWPYLTETFDQPPPAELFSYCDDWRALTYIRLDDDTSAAGTLRNVKRFLRGGFPVVLGFSVFTSLSRGADIPFPSYFDAVRGGQATLSVGYDDRRRIGSCKGALLVHNSWGATWGEAGYGWLPYDYASKRLAADFWTVLHPRWLESGEFARPA